jgi:ribosomal protein L11 methyltransferase
MGGGGARGDRLGGRRARSGVGGTIVRPGRRETTAVRGRRDTAVSGRVIRVAVRVAREHADVVTAELLALSPGGLEERDVDERTVELAIYGAAGELPDLPKVRAAAGDALVDVSTSEVPDGWEHRWREWHRPLDVGPLHVRPPWLPPRPGALDVAIEPGRAFGTGAHPSTRLTLALLITVPPHGPLADWGCGSGILSIAAARLGFDPVLACDADPAAVAATLAAAEANEVAIAARGLDLRREPGPWAPTVTANLERRLLLDVAALLERPPERLIVSGLFVEEVDEVVAAFARHGLAAAARRDGDGWSAILLAR